MTGADVVGELLRGANALTAKVLAASIKAGRLPDGVALPALLVRTVSVVDRQPLKRGPTRRRTDRVAVTVRAASYRDQVDVIRILRSVADGWLGSKVGAQSATILLAGTGPDVAGPADTFEQTQDLRVSFDEPA